VAAEFLRRLMGRPPSLPGEIAEAMEELARLAKARPTLAETANMLGDILPALFAEPIPSEMPVITSERAAVKLESGVPLLRGEAIPLDVAAFTRRWLDICTVVEHNRKGPTAEAMRRGLLDPKQLTADVLAGRPEAIHARMDSLGLDAGLAATVLRLTLFPVLTQLHEALTSTPNGRWERGYCPTCGSWPLLGEFRGLEQTRFLRCGQCAAEWEFPRLRCPFCSCTDHRQLGFFFVESEEGKSRVATCDACRGYVKMVSTLTVLSPPMLLTADVATMHLDLAAADRGYEPGASSSQS